MVVIVAAVLVGLVAGLATGGSLSRLANLRFRWWGLVFVGLGLQLVPVPARAGNADHVLAVGLLVASYVILLAFVLANLRLPGFWILAVGFGLNMLVVTVNGGMPVSAAALQNAAGADYRTTVRALRAEGGARHHLVRADDDLVVLADVVPVQWPIPQVLSTGDLVWLAGTVWLVAVATHGRARIGEARPTRPEGREDPSQPPPKRTAEG